MDSLRYRVLKYQVETAGTAKSAAKGGMKSESKLYVNMYHKLSEFILTVVSLMHV